MYIFLCSELRLIYGVLSPYSDWTLLGLCEICSIEDMSGWSYMACRKCFSKLQVEDKHLYCKKCDSFDVEGRIR